MKAKKFIPLLFVAAALSSCDFTEDCDYFGWLRVENNWQGYPFFSGQKLCIDV